MSRSTLFSFLLCWLSAQGSLRADEPSRAEAKRLKDQGTRALNDGYPAQALELFESAYRVYSSPNLQYNIALAHGRLGHDVAAAESYRLFVEEALNAPNDAREYATTTLEQLTQKLGQFDVRGPANAELFIDDVTRGKLPQRRTLFVTAGDHLVRAEALPPGTPPFVHSYAVRAGERVEVTVVFLAPSPSSQPKRIEPVKTWARRNVAGLTLEAIGATSLGSAIGTGVATLELHDYLQSRCIGYSCDSKYRNDLSRAKTLSVATDVLIGVGVATVVTGVILFLVDRHHRRHSLHSFHRPAEVH